MRMGAISLLNVGAPVLAAARAGGTAGAAASAVARGWAVSAAAHAVPISAIAAAQRGVLVFIAVASRFLDRAQAPERHRHLVRRLRTRKRERAKTRREDLQENAWWLSSRFRVFA